MEESIEINQRAVYAFAIMYRLIFHSQKNRSLTFHRRSHSPLFIPDRITHRSVLERE